MNQLAISIILFLSFCLLLSVLWALIHGIKTRTQLPRYVAEQLPEELMARLDHLISWRYVNYLDHKLFVLGKRQNGVYIYLAQMAALLLSLPLAFFMLSGGPGQIALWVVLLLAIVSAPLLYIQGQLMRKKEHFLSAFSFFLDLLKLCLTSGASLNQGLKLCSVVRINPFLSHNLQRLIDDLEQGNHFEAAWSDFGQRCDEPEVDAFVFAILQAHKQGLSLAPILTQQSRRIKTVLFVQAEKKALSLPTKLIFPILFFIFPTTFIVITFPLALNLLENLS